MNDFASAIFMAFLVFDTKPPLSDISRFPDYSTCYHNRVAASKHIQWVEEQMYRSGLRSRMWYGYLQDARWRYAVWDNLEDATNTNYLNESDRRRHLQNVRELLGDEAYFYGNLPEPYPYNPFYIVPIINWKADQNDSGP